MKRFLKVIGIIVFSLIGLCLLFVSILLFALREKTTKFEDCFLPVTLVSTEPERSVQIYNITKQNTSFAAKARFEDYYRDYGVCISTSTPCISQSVSEYYKLTDLPVDIEIMLDGFAIEHDIPLGGALTYFRGKIDSKTVWLDYRSAQRLADPVNENSFKVMGMKDESGQNISRSGWKCTL